MKPILAVLLASVCFASAGFSAEANASATAASDAPPVLKGILVLGQERKFALSAPGSGETLWAGVGSIVAGWQIVAYQERPEGLVLRKDGREVLATVGTGTVTPLDAKTVQSQAEELIGKMRIEEMLAKTLEQQKKSMVAMTKQMFPTGKGGMSADEMAAFQARMIDMMWSEMDPASLQKEFVRIYSEVFTPPELNGLSDFYASPSGAAMIEKTPELQQKMMEVMMPRMMRAMPKIQQMASEMEKERKAAREAQSSSGAAEPKSVP